MTELVGRMDVSGAVFGAGDSIEVYFNPDTHILYFDLCEGYDVIDSVHVKVLRNNTLYTGEDVWKKLCTELSGEVTKFAQDVRNELYKGAECKK